MNGPGHERWHFDLVSRGHRFVLGVLPLRHPESHTALTAFVGYLTVCNAPPPLVDAVLLRCLAILDRHTGGRLPSLVDRYLASGNAQPCACRFHQCVGDLLRYRGIADPLVASAVAEIDKNYANPDLRRSLPQRLGVTSRVLCEAFEKTTGVKTTDYVRSVRLSHAARLLIETHERKVWASVGYNDASNFIHDFEEHFKATPGDYRKRALPSTLPGRTPLHTVVTTAPLAPSGKLPKRAARILVVDDDELANDMSARLLRSHGYVVSTCSNAEDALRETSRLPPNVVLLDHRLDDGMTGLECLHALRRMRIGHQPAAALVTADWAVQDQDVRELEAILVHRPCDLDQIVDTVAYLLCDRPPVTSLPSSSEWSTTLSEGARSDGVAL